jgi:hypothetical protein
MGVRWNAQGRLGISLGHASVAVVHPGRKQKMFLEQAQTFLHLITSFVLAPQKTVAGPQNTQSAAKTDHMRLLTAKNRTPDSQSRLMALHFFLCVLCASTVNHFRA